MNEASEKVIRVYSTARSVRREWKNGDATKRSSKVGGERKEGE